MSIIKSEDSKKWINAFIAVVAILAGFITIRFVGQMGEWFDLESKIGQYMMMTQVISVLISLGTFIYIMKNPKISTFMTDVYQEAIKVVWPDKNETVKHTIAIMIGVTIVGFILGIFDFVSTWLLSLIQ